LALLELNFEKLMDSFFVVKCVHDGQVNDATEVDKAGLCPVFNTFLCFHDCMNVSRVSF
jgi:hypothetical protein